jgi:hypothetical protein
MAIVENIFPPVPADLAVALGAFLSHRGVIDAFTAFVVLIAMSGAIGVYFMARRFGAICSGRRSAAGFCRPRPSRGRGVHPPAFRGSFSAGSFPASAQSSPRSSGCSASACTGHPANRHRPAIWWRRDLIGRTWAVGSESSASSAS